MTTLSAKSRKLLGQRSVHPLTFTSDGCAPADYRLNDAGVSRGQRLFERC